MFERELEADAAFLGIPPWRLSRIQPRDIFILKEGEAKRWSRTAELVAWAVWQIVVSIPMAGRGDHGQNIFSNFLKRNRPPGFIPPKVAERDRWSD